MTRFISFRFAFVAWLCFFGLASVAPSIAAELAGGDNDFVIEGIDPDACRQLAPYLSQGEADYQPGIAVDGSAVAPADLDGGYAVPPRQFYEFPVKIRPLADSASPVAEATELEVAHVIFDAKSGRVTLDGQDISGGNRALSEACAHLSVSSPQ
tara:strand:- start:22455 stop:22916 length:462 start_codon:yes stop_codon:yes gene_type:complete